MGTFLSTNYTYDNIYLMDASFRMDGSSEFGSKKKFAPFWSFGAGLNIHNYPFMKQQTLFSQFKIRGSYGQIGKVNFPAYAAKNTYQILSDKYGTGAGVLLYYMGNENLKWERTNTFDIGTDISLLNDAVLFRFLHQQVSPYIVIISERYRIVVLSWISEPMYSKIEIGQ